MGNHFRRRQNTMGNNIRRRQNTMGNNIRRRQNTMGNNIRRGKESGADTPPAADLDTIETGVSSC
jgi:hypothetical protein